MNKDMLDNAGWQQPACVYITIDHISRRKIIRVTPDIKEVQKTLVWKECIVYIRHFPNLVDAFAHKSFLANVSEQTLNWFIRNKSLNEIILKHV